MKFKVPKEFECGGQLIRVSNVDNLRKVAGCFGQAHMDLGEILLDTAKTPEDTQAITFYHEKVHIILKTMGEKEMCGNEEFVDTFANLLWQTDKTAKY